MRQFGLILLVAFKLASDHSHGSTASVAVDSNYKFSKLPSSSVSSIAFGLSEPGWNGVSSTASCAIETTTKCLRSRGFIYNQLSRQCIPVLWLHEGSGGTAVGVGELHSLPGEFYVNDKIIGACGDGFEAVEYGSERRFCCLVELTSSVTYDDATQQCNNLGGYLATVKTVEKLQMVINIAQGKSFWVGMDDLAQEGMHRWQENGELLTADVQAAVFKTNEPNNDYGVEDCIQYRGSHFNLNDIHCWATMRALCESQPLSADIC
ncbi:C-type lectin-related protein 4 [Plakobranchus ocellatus]|uniref:C-type lectin-related protein 4 n=1 Tax=Plakobranchus ocellatus TaxID=259542 RepID=A0AAV4DNP2_9GAST|nr:C-type lectin-related protein 4 [Plakobranchus ocellatus]